MLSEVTKNKFHIPYLFQNRISLISTQKLFHGSCSSIDTELFVCLEILTLTRTYEISFYTSLGDSPYISGQNYFLDIVYVRVYMQHCLNQL